MQVGKGEDADTFWKGKHGFGAKLLSLRIYEFDHSGFFFSANADMPETC